MQDAEGEVVCRRATLDDSTPARLLAGEGRALDEPRDGVLNASVLLVWFRFLTDASPKGVFYFSIYFCGLLYSSFIIHLLC